jgi:peptide/nickel transport system substrate-binding protein
MAPDARSFTFHLRHGVQWQRGYGEFTADDVAFTIARMRDPKTGTAYGANFRHISRCRHHRPVHRNDPRDQTQPVLLRLRPDARFGGYIVPKKAMTELGEDFRRNPVGTGPFEFVSYDPKQKIITKANATYWDGKPKIDRMEVLFLPETSSRTLAFVKGDVDMIEGATVPGWLASVKRQKPDLVQDLGRPGAVWAFYLNMTRKPLDDVRVRQAIAHAIDIRAWTAAFGDFVSPMYGVSPVGYYGALDKEDLPQDWPFTYDPARSKALLTEAGLPNGFSMDIFVTEREEYKTNVLIIQEQLRKVGIQLNVRAKVACPAKKVLSIFGDGGFMFNVQELSTAVAHGIDVVAIVMNDGAFGNVKRIQQTQYGGRMIGVDLHNPDFVALAKSFGMRAIKAETPEALRSALRSTLATPGPALIEIPVGELPSIWGLIKRPPSAG